MRFIPRSRLAKYPLHNGVLGQKPKTPSPYSTRRYHTHFKTVKSNSDLESNSDLYGHSDFRWSRIPKGAFNWKIVVLFLYMTLIIFLTFGMFGMIVVFAGPGYV